MSKYLNLNEAAVAVIYASIPREVLESPTGMFLRYNEQRDNCNRRNVKLELTREQWCALWWVSGKWYQRGNASDQFQMCRKDDLGEYSMGNVRIDTSKSNGLDVQKSPKYKASRKKLAKPFIATCIKTGEEFYCESSTCEQAKALELNSGAVVQRLHGKYKQHKGFTFRYV